MADVSELARILRPLNCVMVGFAVLIGEIVVHRTIYPVPSLLGFITGFTITGASMVSNDYFDRDVDKVNNPDRPIPSGRVKPKEAIIFAAVLSIIGLVAACFTNPPSSLPIASIGLLMFILYNSRIKQMGLPGNIVVSASITLPLVYGGMIHSLSSTSMRNLIPLILFEIMIFLSNTGREVNKGISDVEGDKVRNVSTVALKHGPRIAAELSASLYISAAVLSPIPWLLNLVSWPYAPLVALTDLGFLASSFILLRNHSKENALRVKKMALIWMLLGLLSFIAGVL